MRLPTSPTNPEAQWKMLVSIVVILMRLYSTVVMVHTTVRLHKLYRERVRQRFLDPRILGQFPIGPWQVWEMLLHVAS